jgi:hypothetical protein
MPNRKITQADKTSEPAAVDKRIIQNGGRPVKFPLTPQVDPNSVIAARCTEQAKRHVEFLILMLDVLIPVFFRRHSFSVKCARLLIASSQQ